MLKLLYCTIILIFLLGTETASGQSDEVKKNIKEKFTNEAEQKHQLAAYNYLEMAPDQEIRNIADFLFANNFRWQKREYEKQLAAKFFMESTEDIALKSLSSAKYPENYRIQKYYYESQLAAKQYMQTTIKTAIYSKVVSTHPNDYFKQKMLYHDEVFFSPEILTDIAPYLVVKRKTTPYNPQGGFPPLDLLSFHIGDFSLKFIADGPVVMRTSLGPKMMTMCQRPVSEKTEFSTFWEPTFSQITMMELKLTHHLSNRKAEKKHVPSDHHFERQYIGVTDGDKKYIYGNYVRYRRGVNELGPPLYPACNYHGGNGYWGILFDPTTKIFSEFRTNTVY